MPTSITGEGLHAALQASQVRCAEMRMHTPCSWRSQCADGAEQGGLVCNVLLLGGAALRASP